VVVVLFLFTLEIPIHSVLCQPASIITLLDRTNEHIKLRRLLSSGTSFHLKLKKNKGKGAHIYIYNVECYAILFYTLDKCMFIPITESQSTVWLYTNTIHKVYRFWYTRYGSVQRQTTLF
jgi:hypothetical protein